VAWSCWRSQCWCLPSAAGESRQGQHPLPIRLLHSLGRLRERIRSWLPAPPARFSNPRTWRWKWT